MRALIVAVAVFATAATPPAQTPTQAPQQPPVFRAGTTLIPVDVRVVDREGRPVTDLTQADFTLSENGVRQQIRHFSKQALTPDSSPEALAAPTRADAPRSDDLVPQNRRLFLIVLGRGRLQPPANGVDGMIHLVRERLLPQDQVAVIAWNRATEFTADHSTIIALLQRFKKAHEAIESKLAMRFSGLAAMYGGNQIPESIQRDIDVVFGPRAAGVRTLVDMRSPNASRMADDARRDLDLLLNPATNAIDQAQVDALGLTFDEYISANAQSNQDLGKLYLGVEYLRHLDGEKHLVFVSEKGLQLPRAEDEMDLAAAATDARVVIDYVHTGGMAFGGGMGVAEARGRMAAPPSAMVTFAPSMIARTLAERTGGSYYANRFRDAAADMDQVDQVTRFGYLLGYYPSRALDGKYRQIRVQVNRPGLTVLYRHGYFAVAEIAPFNRQRILTYGRVTSAAGFGQDIHDLGIRVKVVAKPEVKGQPRDVEVTSTIDISRIKFTRSGRLRVASIQLAVFVLDGSDKPLGLSWKTVELTFSDDRYEQYLKDGVPVTITVPVSREPKNVKVVAYDYGADILGSAVTKIMK